MNKNIDKRVLIDTIVNHLNIELSTLQTAANNAHLAAIDDQSVAETQYDTLAIEAGYLAEGQSRRVLEIKFALQQFNELAAKIDTLLFDEHSEISTGALVQLAEGKASKQWYFLAPAAAGFKTSLPLKGDLQQITVITEKSPVGAASLGLCQEDHLALFRANKAENSIIYKVI